MKRTIPMMFCLLLAFPLAAHEGHDHGDGKTPLPNLGDAPMRQPDGMVFLPKAAQRRMGIRTQPVHAETLTPSRELAGRVVGDPQRGGQVQTQLGGRIEAAGTLPMAGSRVKKGQVLAWVAPAIGPAEKAQAAESRAALALAERRLARLQALSETVPQKEIDAAMAEIQALRGRLGALGGGPGREALVAPVAGVIAASHVRLGDIVDARAPVFEIIDPDSLVIEALSYETWGSEDIEHAVLAVGEQQWTLRLLAASRQLREQALPLLFAHRGPGAGLALPLGQPVKIQVFSRSTVKNSEKGWAVPQSALVRSAANEPMVWVKRAPEEFMPKPVRVQPLDGRRVLVTQGLADGDRVVVEGANLVAQIR